MADINAVEVDQIGQEAPVQRNEVIVTLDGRELSYSLDTLGLSMESTPDEVIAAIRPVVQEEQGANINDEHGKAAFTVFKALNTSTIHVYPKTVMG